MNKRFLIAVMILSFVFRTAYPGTTGKISGRIIDADTNEPIIGANIYLENTDFGAVSDADGNYFIINVSPGTYNLVCSFIGYEKITYTGITVNVDRTTSVDFNIRPETIQGKEVVVVGERKIIEMDRTSTAAYVSSEKIETMPVQEVDDLIQLQTGVVKDASGEFHIRGGRAGEIAYLIDGVPVTDQYNGGSSVGLENNWVQELQVISGTFNAEYGQAQSGIVNIITKEGAKKFSGRFSVSLGDY
ncbi:MAG: TonB-dependent receptor, partial [Candidatus Neomarinimicrobiota bacterium]